MLLGASGAVCDLTVPTWAQPTANLGTGSSTLMTVPRDYKERLAATFGADAARTAVNGLCKNAADCPEGSTTRRAVQR
jgi:hypothetical protein